MFFPADTQTVRHGFTLVELSIVLVVVGLIVGGTMIGKDMYEQAQFAKIASSLEPYQAATARFVDKYQGLPGDITNATRFWPTAPSCPTGSATGTRNGNGDGLVAAGTYTGSERTTFFQQLAYAGMIQGRYSSAWPLGPLVQGEHSITLPFDTTAVPRSYTTADTTLFYQTQMLGNVLLVGRGDTSSFIVGYVGSFKRCAAALVIDQKIDDGKPGTGRVQHPRTFCTTDNTMTSGNTADYDAQSQSGVVLLFDLD